MDSANRSLPRRGPLIALIAADGLSRFGSVMTVTAIPWFVLVTTGSVARTGLVVFASGIGVVLALLFGGAVVDRMSVRRASVTGDLVAGCIVALIPASYLTVGLPFWLLLLLVFLATLLDIPAQVARYSALPDLSDRAEVRFERANATFDAILTAAALVGPAVAGVLIAFIGASNVLWLDSATFGLSALLMGTLVRDHRSSSQDRVPGGYLAQVLDAARFVVRDPILGPLVAVLAVMNLAVGPIEPVVVPVFARDIYHSSYALGALTSAIALGGLGGNALFGLLGHRLSRRAVFGLGFLAIPVTFAVLSIRPAFPIALVMLVLVGLGLSLTNLLEYTIYFERLPKDMRARGLGITGALNWGTVPLGRIAAGFGIAAVGVATTMATFCLVFLPAPLSLLFWSRFANLNQTATEAPER